MALGSPARCSIIPWKHIQGACRPHPGCMSGIYSLYRSAVAVRLILVIARLTQCLTIVLADMVYIVLRLWSSYTRY